MNSTMHWSRLGLLAGAALAIAGCPTNNPPPGMDAGRDAPIVMTDTPPGIDTGVDAPPGVDVGPVDSGPLPDAPVVTCPAESARDTVNVAGPITADQHWTCEHNYLLTGGPVFVNSGVVVTIDPGVVVRGQVRDGTRRCSAGPRSGETCHVDSCAAVSPFPGCTDCPNATPPLTPAPNCGAPAELGTALIFTRGSRIEANGTAAQPIVFTSERTGTATAPAPGNWGGIVLLGAAPTNNTPPDGAIIEGLPPTAEGLYGGTNAAHDCGSISYARIEYAGSVFGRNNELNGLTIGGCGTDTDIHHVQVHRGLDDGVEVFGGTLNLHHIVVTGSGDDSLDWDLGWTGNVQFYLAQQRNAPGEERCIEGDNHPTNFSAPPRALPTVYNFTCIGAGNVPGVTATGRMSMLHDGAMIRRGSAGIIRNSIFFGSPDNGIQIDDQETGTPAMPPADSDTVQLYVGGTLIIENNILFNIGDTGAEAVFRSDPHRVGGAEVTSRAAVEAMLVADNRVVDPVWGGNPNDFLNPDFSPSAAAAGTMTAAEPATPAGFWQDVSYAGAVNPDDSDLWFMGWTRWTD